MPSHSNGLVICEVCRGIDFAFLVQQALDKKDSDSLDGPMIPLVHSEQCELCAILTPNRPIGERGTLYPYLFQDESEWVCKTAVDAYQTVALSITNAVKDSEDWQDDYFINTAFCIPQSRADADNVLWKPRPLMNTPDYKTALEWLGDCREHHSPDCDHSPPPRIQGLHLIDVQESRIVVVEDSTDYCWVALSYVWGDKNQCPPITMTGTESLPKSLPRTIEDAITVAKELDYRYLWVDEICINQEDPNHRASQIGKMDQIYRGADLTIVAAAGDNKVYGLPGVSTSRVKHPVYECDQSTIFGFGPNPCDSLDGSTWWSRAWTFQEAQLSRRILLFTDDQMVFYCTTSAWMEVLGGPPPGRDSSLEIPPVNPNLWDFILRSDNEDDEPFASLINFERLITNYSERKLSFASDALNAVTGVLSHSCQEKGPIYNFAGLPYYRGSSEASLIPLEQAIGHALSWHTDGMPSSRREMFPSWTWAGWTGQVKWEWPKPTSGTISPAHMRLRHIQLENQAGEILHLPELPNTASGPELQRELSTVVAVSFEAPAFIASCVVPGDLDPKIGSEPLNLKPWLPPDVRESFLSNVQQGLWSCFIVSEQPQEESFELSVLVCRWKEGQTAERLGCFIMSSMSEENIRSLRACLETRHVKLI